MLKKTLKVSEVSLFLRIIVGSGHLNSKNHFLHHMGLLRELDSFVCPVPLGELICVILPFDGAQGAGVLGPVPVRGKPVEA